MITLSLVFARTSRFRLEYADHRKQEKWERPHVDRTDDTFSKILWYLKQVRSSILFRIVTFCRMLQILRAMTGTRTISQTAMGKNVVSAIPVTMIGSVVMAALIIMVNLMILVGLMIYASTADAATPSESADTSVVSDASPLPLPPPPNNANEANHSSEAATMDDVFQPTVASERNTEGNTNTNLASSPIPLIPIRIPRANLVFTPGDTLEIHAGPCAIPETETWPMRLEWNLFGVDPLTGKAKDSVLASGETTLSSAMEISKLLLPISTQEGLVEVRLALMPIQKQSLALRSETPTSNAAGNSWNPLGLLPGKPLETARQFFASDAVLSRSFRILVLSQNAKIPADGRKSASANRAKSLTERYTPNGFAKVIDPESAEFAVVVAEFDPSQPAVNVTKNVRWSRPEFSLPSVPKFKLPEWKNPFRKQTDDSENLTVHSATDSSTNPADSSDISSGTSANIPSANDSAWTYWSLEHLTPGQPHWIELVTDMPASFAVCVIGEHATVVWGTNTADRNGRATNITNRTSSTTPQTSTSSTTSDGVTVNGTVASGTVANGTITNGVTDSTVASMRRYRFLFWATSERSTLAMTRLADPTPISYQSIRVLTAPDGIAIPAKTVRSGKRLMLADLDDTSLPAFLGAGANENGEWPANERLLETLRYAHYDGLIRTISTDHLTGLTTSSQTTLVMENPVTNDGGNATNKNAGEKTEHQSSTNVAGREVPIWALTDADRPSVMAITDPSRIDSVEGLLRLTDREGLMFVPRLSGTLNRSENAAKGHGTDGANTLSSNGPNPLSPEFQRSVIRSVQEIAWRYGSHASFGGVALDLSAGSAFRFDSPDAGLDTQNFAQFVQDTGFKVAPECLVASDSAATWTARRLAITQIGLNGHTTWRTEWLLWRAGQLTQFYGQLADIIRRVRPEARLWLLGYDTALEPICESPLEAGLHAATLQVDARFFSSIFEQTPIGSTTQTTSQTTASQTIDPNARHTIGTDCTIGYATARRVECIFPTQLANNTNGTEGQSSPSLTTNLDPNAKPDAVSSISTPSSTTPSVTEPTQTMTTMTDFEPSVGLQKSSSDASTTRLRLQPIQDVARQALCEMWAYHDIRIFCDATFQGCFEMRDVKNSGGGENTQNMTDTQNPKPASEKNPFGAIRRDTVRTSTSTAEENQTTRFRDVFRNFPTLPTERFRSPSPSEGQPVVLRWCSDGRSTWLVAINTSPFPVQAQVKLVTGRDVTAELLLSETAPQFQWNAGRLVWTVPLPPYMGEVIRFAEAEVPIDDYTVSWSAEVDAEIQRRIQRLGQRITEIANPSEWAFSENPGFERTYANQVSVKPSESTEPSELTDSFQPILPGWRLRSLANETCWKQIACSTESTSSASATSTTTSMASLVDTSLTDMSTMSTDTSANDATAISTISTTLTDSKTHILPMEYEKGNQALYLANRSGITTLLSDSFPLPSTGRLTIRLRLRAVNATAPRIRVGIEGMTDVEHSEQANPEETVVSVKDVVPAKTSRSPHFHSTVVFDGNDYQTTWNELVVHVTDPTGLTLTSSRETSSGESSGCTMAWLRIELLDPGAIELDEICMNATALTRQEQTILFKQVAPASVFWSQRRLSDCMAILTGRVPEALENWDGYFERVAAGEQKPLRMMR